MTMYINMNMRIIMAMNIYISPQNEKKLRNYGKDLNHRGHTMSGLVNKLLEKHFYDRVVGKLKAKPSSESLEPTEPDIATPIKTIKKKPTGTSSPGTVTSSSICPKHNIEKDICKFMKH